MKKMLVLITCAFLLFNCSDTKDSKSKEKDEKETPGKEITKKPKSEQKQDLKNLFDNEDVKKEDTGGWPTERKKEVLAMCMQDAGDMPVKYAEAYCNCQLENIMKIFGSYAVAMNIFNKMEEELTDGDQQKLEKVMMADENCMEQNMDQDGSEEDEEDGNDQ